MKGLDKEEFGDIGLTCDHQVLFIRKNYLIPVPKLKIAKESWKFLLDNMFARGYGHDKTCHDIQTVYGYRWEKCKMGDFSVKVLIWMV